MKDYDGILWVLSFKTTINDQGPNKRAIGVQGFGPRESLTGRSEHYVLNP